jgi:hypothetical protein
LQFGFSQRNKKKQIKDSRNQIKYKMKKTILTLAIFATLFSCKEEKKEVAKNPVVEETKEIALRSPEVLPIRIEERNTRVSILMEVCSVLF